MKPGFEEIRDWLTAHMRLFLFLRNIFRDFPRLANAARSSRSQARIDHWQAQLNLSNGILDRQRKYIRDGLNAIIEILGRRGIDAGCLHELLCCVNSFHDCDDAIEELWPRCYGFLHTVKLNATVIHERFPGETTTEITLAIMNREYDIPKPTISNACKKRPDEPGYLLNRKIGRSVLIPADHAKRFAENHEARREQRAIASLRRDKNSVSQILKNVGKVNNS